MYALAAGAPADSPGIMVVLAACLTLLALNVSVLAAVHAPKVVSEHTPDLHSLEDFVAGVVRPGMTQKQKAHAVWEAMADLMYHWCNPVEAPRHRSGAYSDVTDPIRLMNVYGFTLCFCSGGAMASAWRAAGLEAREFGLPGHIAPEVWYEGAYHYLDVEFKGFFRKPDGRIASIRECGLRPAELMVKPALPRGFFPLSKSPFRTYLSRMVYAGIADEGPAWYGSFRGQSGHVMNVSLRKGETYYRAWDNVGRYVCDYQRWLDPANFGTFDVRYGPKDKASDRAFGNGILIYQPDLTRRTDEYEDGVLAASDIAKTDEGLTCRKGAKSASAVFRFQLPYVIAGDPNKIDQPDTTTGAAVLSIDGAGEIDVLISTDDGRTWRPAGVQAGRADLTRFVERCYGYQLKFVLKGGAVLRGFRAETSFQLAPTSLPALKAGDNRMTFSLGADPYEMATWDAPMWTTDSEFRAAAYRTQNIRWQDAWPMAVSTRDRAKSGYVIYELKAPPGKRLRKVSIDLGGSLRHRQWHEDRVELCVAQSEPKDFRRIGGVRGGPYSGHWLRRLYREVDLPRARDVRTLYVRFDIFCRQRAAVSDCRFRTFFEDEKPKAPNLDGLVITHGWLEDGKIRTSRKRSPRPNETYTVRTGEKFQRPLFVCMQVPGRAGARAESDPLGLAGYRKRPASFYPKEAAGFSNEEILLRLDREGLAGSDAMEEILLRGKNRRIAREVEKMLGYRPVEAVRAYLEQLHRKSPTEPRWLRGLALLDERKAPSRAAFLRTYLPTLKADRHGLSYIAKIGEVGSAGDIPPLLEALGKADHPRLKLALATAAMALGDESVVEEASALVTKVRNPEHRIPADTLLIGHPAHADAAKGRLLKLLASPDFVLRWNVLTELSRRAGPGGPPAAEEIAAKGLADENPHVRLAALSVLWNRATGHALVQRAMRDETQAFLKDAYREFLKRPR